jgi:hypothetical protein
MALPVHTPHRMEEIDSPALEASVGGQAQYLCTSNGYQGEPIIKGQPKSTFREAKESYTDACKGEGNWGSACWINRVCGRIR